MANLNIQNSKELEQNNQNVSLWRKGKQDIKKFYDIKFNKSTNVKTLVFGILITAVIIIPFATILIQILQAYVYQLNLCMFLMLIGWIMLLICNGLSNYFSIKLAKLYYKENPKLQNIDEMAVMFYETLNPGFIIFSFMVLIVLFFGMF
jgi:hypothetical protein